MTAPICSVVIPVHNHASLTRRCLDAVFANAGETPFEVIVVDDASTDATDEVLRLFSHQLCVVRHDRNVGFARACNSGAEKAGGRYLIFLNNDTIVTPGWLDALVAYVGANDAAAVVGCKLLYLDDTVQHAGTFINHERYPRHAYVGFPRDHPAVNKSRRVQVVTAACMLVRREAFDEAGGFDTAFRNGWEDVDLCLRLQDSGHEIHYCHTAVVYHLEFATRDALDKTDDLNRRLYDRRWRHRVTPDDVGYFAEDGVIGLDYDQWPLRLRVSPLLAALPEAPAEFGPVLRQKYAEIFRLSRENIQLAERVADLEFALERSATPAHGRPRTNRKRADSELAPGINVVGYLRGEFGVAEAARRYVDAVDAAGIPCRTTVLSAFEHSERHPFKPRKADGRPFDTNVLCATARETPTIAATLGRRFFEGRYTIGAWFWEVEEFPPTMFPGFDYVDEVWVPTEHVRCAVEAASPVPVFTIPPPVALPQPQLKTSSAESVLPGLGDGGRFAFLFIFDFFSVFERKNPLGLIEAFTKAFRPDEGPVLIIKAINGERFPAKRHQLQRAAANRPDIRVVDRHLTSAEMNVLAEGIDCYVSLHRSEGFGLTMAEAMMRGKPVIATGYSGNLDFMTGENSYLVPFTLASIPAGCEPYPEGAQWADPDLDAAAAAMRDVYYQRDKATAIGEIGRATVSSTLSPEACARAIAERYRAIHEGPLAVEDHSRFASVAATTLSYGPGTTLAHRLAPERTAWARTLVRILEWPARIVRHPGPVMRVPAHVARRLFRPTYLKLLRRAGLI